MAGPRAGVGEAHLGDDVDEVGGDNCVREREAALRYRKRGAIPDDEEEGGDAKDKGEGATHVRGPGLHRP